jgi:hypothetical protein
MKWREKWRTIRPKKYSGGCEGLDRSQDIQLGLDEQNFQAEDSQISTGSMMLSSLDI